MFIERRNIPLCVVLSIITCGIFMIYWMYKITEDLYNANEMESKAGLDIVLSMITCGIFFIYLNYKWGKMLDSARRMRGKAGRDDSVLFLVLAILGFSIVNMCIIQSGLNEDLSSDGGTEYDPNAN